MDRVDKYKRIEDNQQQRKGKAKVVPQERRDFRSNKYNNNRSRKDYSEQPGSNNNQVVGVAFREPMHQVLEKIKNESFFKWPNKMIENPEKRLQEFMGSLGSTYPRRKTEAAAAPF